ncbi:MAG: CoA transferase [Dehalococcoidia bacterium]
MPRLPLEGVRVIDVTVVWAGPFGAQLLAEWGAEVIRMEPISAIQPQTRGAERARFLSREAVERAVATGSMAAGYPNRDPGADPWNRGALFNSASSNKLSFTGNMMTRSGRETFEELVAISDVVIENNVPSTAEKMGIVYEQLRAINPGIIVVRMPGFGLSGPYSDYRCWGNHLEGMAGHHIVRSYPDMTLDAVGESYACDSVAGLTAALGAVMALRHRRRTGRGQQVEIPQIEAVLQLMGTEILDYTMNGRVAGAMGNDHRSHAPHGAYPCRSEGEGGPHDREWIAIDVCDERQWTALCATLGAADLTADRRFASMASRWQHRRDLDAALGRHTERWDKLELFHALQAAGVPAGPVQNEGECFRCPQMAARGFFQEQTRADIGTFRYPSTLFQWTDTPNHFRRPPAKLGQDNDYVYRDLLGRSAAEVDELVAAGEVGTTYPEWLLRGA